MITDTAIIIDLSQKLYISVKPLSKTTNDCNVVNKGLKNNYTREQIYRVKRMLYLVLLVVSQADLAKLLEEQSQKQITARTYKKISFISSKEFGSVRPP